MRSQRLLFIFILCLSLSLGWSVKEFEALWEKSSVLESCCQFGTDLSLSSKLFDCLLKTNEMRAGNHAFSLLTYTTSDIVAYSAYSIVINSAYAEYAQYQMKVLTPADGAAYEPKDERWNKVKILLDAISDGDVPGWTAGVKNEKTEYVVWIDADLVLLDFSFRLEEIVAEYPEADLLLSSDPYPEEIFSVVNTGFIIVKVSDRSRAFLSEWWGSSGQRQQGWDQHAFTKLYLDGRHSIEGGGAYRDMIQVLAPDAVNTHRPATVYQKPHNPVLHMIGSVLRHRQRVFSSGLRALCSTSAGSPLPPQLGLTRERLVEIEEEVLGSRGQLAKGLLEDLQSLSLSTQHQDKARESREEHHKGPSSHYFGALTALKRRLDEVMKLGDPRAGAVEGEVAVIRSCLLAMLELCLSALHHHDQQHQQHQRGESNGWEGFPSLTATELVSVLEWGIDAGFELSLERPVEQVLALMASIEPLTSRLVSVLSSRTQQEGRQGEREDRDTDEGAVATAYYFHFKRLQFAALARMEEVAAPDDGTQATETALLAVREALGAWVSLTRVNAPLSTSRVEEGARVKESLGLLLCGRRDHGEGIVLLEEALAMQRGVWGGPSHTAHDSLSSASQQALLGMIPRETRVALTRSYYNLAICEADKAEAGERRGESNGGGSGSSLQLYSSALAHVEQAKAVLSSVHPKGSGVASAKASSRPRRSPKAPHQEEEEGQVEEEDEEKEEHESMWRQLEGHSRLMQSKIGNNHGGGGGKLGQRGGAAERKRRARGKRKVGKRRRKRGAEEL